MRDAFYFDLEKRVNDLAKVSQSNVAILATEIEVIKCKQTAMERYFFVGGFSLFMRLIKSLFMPSFAAYEFQTLFQAELMRLSKQKEEIEKRRREAEEKKKTEIQIVKPGHVVNLPIVGGHNGKQ